MLPLSVLSVLENITAFASRENMVFGKFRRLNFLSTVPAIVVALYLCKVVFEQIMYIPSTFFICLERFSTNHIAHPIALLLTSIDGITQHLQVGIRIEKVLPKVRKRRLSTIS